MSSKLWIYHYFLLLRMFKRELTYFLVWKKKLTLPLFWTLLKQDLSNFAWLEPWLGSSFLFEVWWPWLHPAPARNQTCSLSITSLLLDQLSYPDPLGKAGMYLQCSVRWGSLYWSKCSMHRMKLPLSLFLLFKTVLAAWWRKRPWISKPSISQLRALPSSSRIV